MAKAYRFNIKDFDIYLLNTLIAPYFFLGVAQVGDALIEKDYQGLYGGILNITGACAGFIFTKELKKTRESRRLLKNSLDNLENLLNTI